MLRSWTFGKKIAAGFAISSILLITIGIVAYLSISSLITMSYSVAHTHKIMEEISNVLSAFKDAETGQRGYIITANESYLEPYNNALESAPKLMKELRELTADSPEEVKHLDKVELLATEKFAELKRTIDLRRSGMQEQAVKLIMSDVGKKYMDGIRHEFEQMEYNANELLKQRAKEAESTVAQAKSTIIFGTLICLLFVSCAGYFITHSLSGQIGSAVGRVQSSSAELQTAALQQASGAKEHATAMGEISTTINELVATSRQIAESAQRVAQIAEQTAGVAQTGDSKVEKGQESISDIRQQVDLVVTHMLDLGKKSQEIAAVLDIVSELAEQTNILAINATIEAIGAGDAGKRFAVVADEIRKLADRVANSTKEIRNQIEGVRGAVNTTVMATESSAKAVDAGVRQFLEVAQAFKQIASQVETTKDAAREIELSTKQQATAAEQVRVAVSNVSETTKETETSSSQTLQTASELAGLSTELKNLVQPQRA
jgi:CHASE3 domain sensor protein